MKKGFFKSDGTVKYIPKRMDVDHEGITILVEYKIDEKIKDLGFDYTYSNPRFWI
ncbi:hypothetical protein [Natranaerobius thermophilus]|uniref:hypothetical protein n=1 Tax=Natranaerobius thermophilus TaxID=375929 RepID=UPI00030A45C2|nr:hypothetical protein [Natranaerobius thermophilus]